MVPAVWVRSPTIVGAGAGDRPESETVLQKSAASLNGVPLVAACLRPQHRPSISRPVGTPSFGALRPPTYLELQGERLMLALRTCSADNFPRSAFTRSS